MVRVHWLLLFANFVLLGMACSQAKPLHPDALKQAIYLAPLEGDGAVHHIVYVSNDSQQLFIGLINQDYYMLGQYYPLLWAKQQATIQVDDEQWLLKPLKPNQLRLILTDESYIDFVQHQQLLLTDVITGE